MPKVAKSAKTTAPTPRMRGTLFAHCGKTCANERSRYREVTFTSTTPLRTGLENRAQDINPPRAVKRAARVAEVARGDSSRRPRAALLEARRRHSATANLLAAYAP